ncbi:MAG: STAS domain-containing protein [Leptospiraceae bacterium]|nr:STAS domain-containing protein [Leptospiraceae bacterium]
MSDVKSNFTFKKVKDTIVVYLSGTLDTKKSRDIEEDLEQILTQFPNKNVLLNMKDLRYMSSSGLRVLVSLRSVLQETGYQLKICNMGRNVREVFELTKVLQFFKIFEDEISALEDREIEDDDED